MPYGAPHSIARFPWNANAARVMRLKVDAFPALTDSSFAGSTTNAPRVTTAIAAAVNPNAARGNEGS